MTGKTYLWTGPINSNWNAASNWTDTTTGSVPAVVAPGSADAVTFASPTNLFQVISGTGNSASLSFTGENVIEGQLQTGMLTVGGTLDIEAGATLNAASASGALNIQGVGATLAVSGDFDGQLSVGAAGTVAIGGALLLQGLSSIQGAGTTFTTGGAMSLRDSSLTASNGAAIQVVGNVSIGIDQPYSSSAIVTDRTSSLEVGTTGNAVAGATTIDSGATFSVIGNSSLFFGVNISYLAGNILDNGLIDIAAAGVLVLGSSPYSSTSNVGNVLSGTGLIQVGDGASVSGDAMGDGSLTLNLGTGASADTGAIGSGNTINLGADASFRATGTIGAGTSINFTGTGGVLSLTGTTISDSGTITGFNASDAILLSGAGVTSATYTGNTLSLLDGTTNIGSLTLSGDYTGETFLVVPISSGESEVTLYAALVTEQGTTITVTSLAGQTVSLDTLVADTNLVTNGVIQTLVVEGSGTVGVSSNVTINDLHVGVGASVADSGATITTDPVTIDASGSINGFGTLIGAVTDTGSITASGGTLIVTGAVSGTGTLGMASGGTLDLRGVIAATNTIQFNGPTKTLLLGATADVGAAITGWTSGDTIGFDNQTVTAETYDRAAGTLTITGSAGASEVLAFAGNYGQGNFTLSAGSVIETSSIAAPSALMLAPASDSGVIGDDITNVAFPTLTGMAEAGSLVTLTDTEGGTTVVLGTTTASADGSWSFTAAAVGLGEGTQSIAATATDAAGNISAPSVLAVTVETSIAPPTLALAPALDSGIVGDDITNESSPTLFGTAEAGSTVKLTDISSVNPVALGSVVADTSGHWAFRPVSPLPDATYVIFATATDVAGNVSPPVNITLTIDTTSPAAPAGLALASASDSGLTGDSITNVSMPTLTGIAEAGSLVTMTDNSGATPVLLGTTVTNASGAWSFVPTTALAQGGHRLTATATDIAGNVSGASPSFALTIDTTLPPTLAIPVLAAGSDSGTLGDDLTNATMPAIIGSGVTGDVVSLYDGNILIGTGTVVAGNWSITPIAALTNGVHSLTAKQTDAAGNVSIDSGALSLTVDTAVPQAPVRPALAPASDSGTLGDDLTNISAPTITGSGAAGDVVSLHDGNALIGTGIVTSAGSWSITPADPLSNGLHGLTATATDAAGNISLASSVLSLNIDTTTPLAPTSLTLVATSDSGTIGDDITNVTRPAITGSGAAGETISLHDGTILIGTAVVGGNGIWSVMPASALANGAHSLTATGTDAAGNVSAASGVLSLTIDSTASAAPASLILAAGSDSGTLGDDITNVTRPAIAGTGTAGETIRLYDGTSLLGTTTVAKGDNWSITATTVLASGAHSLTATTTDAAGNVSNASATLALTIDTTVAAPTLVQTASDTATASPVLTGAADSGSIVSLYDGSILLGTTVADASGGYSFTVPTALSTGMHVLSAKETDTAGNISIASAALAVTVNADGSYAIVSPAASNGDVVSRVYDSSGHYTSVDTTDSAGLLLQSVTPTSTTRNIYDSAAKLIGTIGEAGSATGIAPPDFATAGLTGGATTATDATASLVTLLSENHSLTLHGNDTVKIDSGNDTISASSGSVSVSGGTGGLTFYGNAGTSTVTGGTGTATIVGGIGGGVYAGGSSARNLLVAAAGNTTLVGGISHDVMFGGSGQNAINGSTAGSDTVIAGSGSNVIAASDNDVVFTAGQSTVYGSAAGGDTVIGSGNDVMVAGGGTNALFGGSGNDTMYGGSGVNVMVGGTGSALMIGGKGTSDFIGGSGQSTVFGGAGNDTVWSGTGTMTATLGNGTDTIVLESGHASVFGGLGSDVYDLINGTAKGNDVISGFKVGTDQVALYGYSASAVQTTSGGSTILDLSDGSRITLLNVTDLKSNSII